MFEQTFKNIDANLWKDAGGEELRRSRTLMPSVLDRAFKGEL